MKAQSYTVLMLMDATPSWLALTRAERNIFFEKTIAPIFSKYNGSCQVRIFDSEYFHGSISDFMIVETNDLRQYRFMIEELRDTSVYSIPYFNIKDIITGVENGFQEFEKSRSGEDS